MQPIIVISTLTLTSLLTNAQLIRPPIGHGPGGTCGSVLEFDICAPNLDCMDGICQLKVSNVGGGQEHLVEYSAVCAPGLICGGGHLVPGQGFIGKTCQGTPATTAADGGDPESTFAMGGSSQATIVASAVPTTTTAVAVLSNAAGITQANTTATTKASSSAVFTGFQYWELLMTIMLLL
ncbi:hypothetical protein BDR26DRAFT_889999 [Obelidium mucronatum]|nr:hypothetical protein BDR26DRAFT_889999 [Obelidium mucronatum]